MSKKLAFLVFVSSCLVGAFGQDNNVTVTSAFFSNETFALGEFSATLEACGGAGLALKDKVLQLRCVKTLISSDATCFEVSGGAEGPLLCDVDGAPFTTENVVFDCAETCPFSNASLFPNNGTAGDCSFAEIAGYETPCFPSAYCQMLSQPTFGGSFGEFCPGSDGEFCCAENAEKSSFEGAMLTSPSAVDFMKDASHITDLSFKIFYDVRPPGLLKITVEVPYVTSESSITYIQSGVAKEYSMCPTTYMIDFQDPVEALPRAEENYYRRTDSGQDWLPLRYFPVSDLVGRPRSACGNFDLRYSSEASFRNTFVFPDQSNASDRLTYSAPPLVVEGDWTRAPGDDTVPDAGETFWQMGVPTNARVNFTTTRFFDIVKTFYECKNYATERRLVERKTDGEVAYLGGVPYAVETYEFSLHACQVGFFGSGCEDPSRPKMYAKTCAVIPASFSVAPQQISHVSSTPSSSNLVSKTFLQSVNGISSDCDLGYERVAVTLSIVIFEPEYELHPDAVHEIISPSNVFESPQSAITLKNATTFDGVYDFLLSNPAEEGVYALRRVDAISEFSESYHRKLIVVTKCYYTGLNPSTKERTSASVFGDATKTQDDKVILEFELALRKAHSSYDIRNTLHVQIIATAETFSLPSVVSLEQKEKIGTTHGLYNSYEAAKADDSPNMDEAVSSQGDATVYEGDQICSKHAATENHARSALLHPHAVGACVLTTEGEALVDGEGTSVAGKNIAYKTPEMQSASSFFFGCADNWLDVSDVAPSPEGIYHVARVVRTTVKTHESSFWFVVGGELNRAPIPGSASGETIAERFASGMFRYDSEQEAYSSDVSAEMRMDSITAAAPRTTLPPGCAEESGYLKGACNLICFDVASRLLTPTGRDNATLLIHHTSVAVLATPEEIRPKHVFSRKRSLLETAEEEGLENTVRRLTLSTSEKSATEPHYPHHHSHHDAPAFVVSDVLLYFSLFLVAIGLAVFYWRSRSPPLTLQTRTTTIAYESAKGLKNQLFFVVPEKIN